MCKRFIDVNIWKQPWYLDLTSEQKVVWHYLTLQCDTAGLWKVELYQLKRDMCIKELNFDEAIAAINRDYDDDKPVTVNRIMFLEGKKKIWITGYISFQYEKGNNGVNGAIPAVKGALNKLKAEGILSYALTNGYLRAYNYDFSSINNLNNEEGKGCQPLARDKDMDKEKDKDNCSSFFKEDGGAGEETHFVSPAIGDGVSLPTLDKPVKFLSEDFFMEHWFRLPHPAELKLADEILLEYGEELFVFALKQALEYHTKKIPYIRAVCKKNREKAAMEKEKAEARKKQDELNQRVANERKMGIKLDLIKQVYGSNDDTNLNTT